MLQRARPGHDAVTSRSHPDGVGSDDPLRRGDVGSRQAAEPARHGARLAADRPSRRGAPDDDSEEDLHAGILRGGEDQPGLTIREQHLLREVPHHRRREDRQEDADAERERTSR